MLVIKKRKLGPSACWPVSLIYTAEFQNTGKPCVNGHSGQHLRNYTWHSHAPAHTHINNNNKTVTTRFILLISKEITSFLSLVSLKLSWIFPYPQYLKESICRNSKLMMTDKCPKPRAAIILLASNSQKLFFCSASDYKFNDSLSLLQNY